MEAAALRRRAAARAPRPRRQGRPLTLCRAPGADQAHRQPRRARLPWSTATRQPSSHNRSRPSNPQTQAASGTTSTRSRELRVRPHQGPSRSAAASPTYSDENPAPRESEERGVGSPRSPTQAFEMLTPRKTSPVATHAAAVPAPGDGSSASGPWRPPCRPRRSRACRIGTDPVRAAPHRAWNGEAN